MTVNIIGKLIKFIGKGIEFTFGIQRPIPDIPGSEFPFSVDTPLVHSEGSLRAERLRGTCSIAFNSSKFSGQCKLLKASWI